MINVNEQRMPGQRAIPLWRKAVGLIISLPGHIHGVFSVLLVIANTVFWFGPVLVISFFKLLVPIKPWQRLMTRILNYGIATTWITFNNFFLMTTNRIEWDIKGLDDLSRDEWYLVVSNHQSWADIVILQKIFNRKIPFLKFFLKKELVWVPILGIVWWALEYPFMRRYSKEVLKKYPHLKGRDFEETRKACEKYNDTPVSVMNFIEGTRYTRKKAMEQQSPYSHLLKPKAGGVGYVLSLMGDKITKILNVTIVYPEGDSSFWSFLCGRVKKLTVRVETIDMHDGLVGNIEEDPAYRERIKEWVNDLWTEKNRKIESLLN